MITTVLFGSLLAQSYATNLFSDVIMKMNVEFTANDTNNHVTQIASMTVHNEQQSSIAFGEHQLDIKTTFLKWEDDAKELDQILAEVKVQKLDAEGHYQLIHSPSFVILRNKWAEVMLDPENAKHSIELKLKYEDFKPVSDDNAALITPTDVSTEWLNWGENELPSVESC
jgi:hypothetical protein